jgi:acylglycerol lipase
MNQPSINRFKLSDGTEIHTVTFRTEKEIPHGDVLFVHGFGDHSGLYGNLIRIINDAGYNAYGYDVRGHGLSSGVRGIAEGISQLVNDLDQVMDYFTSEHGLTDPLLFGHSLGGMVVLDYAAKHQQKLKAVAATSPGLLIHTTTLMEIKLTLGRIIARITPALRMNAGLDIRYLSHDPEIIKRYKNDPLVHGKVSAAFGVNLAYYGAGVIERASRLSIPLFLAHGSADKIVNPEGTVRFFENCRSANKKICIYPGLYHEIFNEPPDMRSPFADDFHDWLMNFKAQ